MRPSLLPGPDANICAILPIPTPPTSPPALRLTLTPVLCWASHTSGYQLSFLRDSNEYIQHHLLRSVKLLVRETDTITIKTMDGGISARTQIRPIPI